MRTRRPSPIMLLFAVVVASILIGPIPPHPRGVRSPQLTQAPPGPHGTRGAQVTPPLPGGRDDYGEAKQLLDAGRLQEAQDKYLSILLAKLPDDPRAMEGLVLVRRRMASDDPATLQQQANVYRRAAISGKDTDQHYSLESLRFLYIATLIAGAQIEAERSVTRSARGRPAMPERRIDREPPTASHVTTTVPAVGAPATHGPSGARDITQPRPGESRRVPVSAPHQIPAHRPAPAPGVRPTPSAPQVPTAPVQPALAVALESPSQERNVGILRAVNCPRQTFRVDGSRSSQEFLVAPGAVIYAGTEKLSRFCTLQRFVGSRLVVWSTKVGSRHTARRIDVLVLSAHFAATRRDNHGDLVRTGFTPPPPSAGMQASRGVTGGLGWNGSQGAWGERIGVIGTKIDNAALVVSRDGAYPIVITAGTRVLGSRATYGEIARFDSVRAHGHLTQSGTLIAEVIEVTHIADPRQLQQIATSPSTQLVLNSSIRTNGLSVGGTVTGGIAREGVGAAAGGASVNGAASVNAGTAGSSGASVSAGASAGGGPSVGGGASVGAGASAGGGPSASGGASVSAGASVKGGGVSVSGAGSANAGASANGGSSANTGASVDIGK